MTKTSKVHIVAAFVLAIVSIPSTVLAVDGVILLDQNKAMAGGVTPGDAPGFPITFTQPGSYRLSSNLTVPSGVSAAIQINADGVTIDLNGFTIKGPGVFGSDPFYGVNSSDRQRTKIHNGSIVGFVVGLQFAGTAQYVTLEKLFINATTISGGTTPILGIGAIVGHDAVSHALIREVQSEGQIQVTCPGLVLDTTGDVVEIKVPYDGSGVGFPTNCKGENVTF